MAKTTKVSARIGICKLGVQRKYLRNQVSRETFVVWLYWRDRMEPGCFYHVYNRGNNREDIFREEENYRFFLQRYKRYVAQYVDTYAFCLMPNHFHFLIRVKDSVMGSEDREGSALTPLEKAFRDFFISYAKSFNQRYHRTGSLFQYKFRRKIIEDDAHQMRLVVYIHRNPVKARLCSAFGDWAYSSYRAIIGTGSTSVQRDAVLGWFGGRESFIAAHQAEGDWDWEPEA